MIAMFAIALLAVSIAGAWALVHTYRHEAAYERRVRRNA